MSKIDSATHRTLQASWYGKLTSLRFEIHDRRLRQKQFSSDQAAAMERLIQPIADDITSAARKHSSNKYIETALDLDGSFKRIIINVPRDDGVNIIVNPVCETSTVVLSTRAISELIDVTLQQAETTELDRWGQNMYLELLNIDEDPELLNISGSYLELLLGPPLNGFREAKLKHGIAAQATAVWKTLAYIIGHEAQHIWAKQCIRNSVAGTQHRRETKADILGTILAIEKYNEQCGREVLATKDDLDAVLNPNLPEPVTSLEAQLIIARIPDSELLAGTSGTAVMVRALSKYFDIDVSHPPATEREISDLRAAKLLTNRIFAGVNSKGIIISFLAKLAGATPDELIHAAYSDQVFKPNYRYTENLLICSDPTLVEQENRRF